MLLIDSQVAIWVMRDDRLLGEQARKTITSSTRVHVSVVTVWELTIKSMLGKLAIPENLTDRLIEQGFLPLDITPQHAEAIRGFPELVRHDPFDRLLVAQAEHDGLRLLTADKVLLGLDRSFILDATR